MELDNCVAIGSDHAGFEVKEEIKKFLESKKLNVLDFGTNSKDSCDYPDYAKGVAEAVASGKAEEGFLICNSGIGMSIAANKVAGIRAALCMTAELAKFSRLHNDANVLCLSAGYLPVGNLKEIVTAWLDASFEGGRHERRVNKIKHMEGSSK